MNNRIFLRIAVVEIPQHCLHVRVSALEQISDVRDSKSIEVDFALPALNPEESGHHFLKKRAGINIVQRVLPRHRGALAWKGSPYRDGEQAVCNRLRDHIGKIVIIEIVDESRLE